MLVRVRTVGIRRERMKSEERVRIVDAVCAIETHIDTKKK